MKHRTGTVVMGASLALATFLAGSPAYASSYANVAISCNTPDPNTSGAYSGYATDLQGATTYHTYFAVGITFKDGSSAGGSNLNAQDLRTSSTGALSTSTHYVLKPIKTMHVTFVVEKNGVVVASGAKTCNG